MRCLARRPLGGVEAEAACFMDGFVEDIRQYPGLQQVQRSVRVKVPGKRYPVVAAF